MNGKILGLLFIGAALLGSSRAGADESNVYVDLYQERVNLAQAELRRQEAETQFRAKHLNRTRILVVKQAASQEDLDRAEADHKKGLAEEDVARAAIAEAQAMLQVVRSLVRNGQDVPLCRL
jgi:multidrug resistance efflux pump